jgi:hypothetical protein
MPDAQKDIGFCEDPPCPHMPKFGKDVSELITSVRILYSNPFTAEYRTTSTMPSPAGVPKTIVQREDVGRDSHGRIRTERHGVARPPDDRKTVTLETPDGKPFTVTQEEFGTLIHISDCASGTSVVLQPGLRIATVKEGNGAPAIGLIKHAYSAS